MVCLPFGLVEYGRIAMHIINEVLERIAYRHQAGLERLQEEITHPFVPGIEVERVGSPNLAHEGGDTSLGYLLHHQVEVVWKEAERTDSDESFATRHAENLFKLKSTEVITPERRLVIGQVEELEETSIFLGIFKYNAIFNATIIAMVPFA